MRKSVITWLLLVFFVSLRYTYVLFSIGRHYRTVPSNEWDYGQPTSLPNFVELSTLRSNNTNWRGRVIFFLHIPKTGGSTLATLLRGVSDHYYKGQGKQQYNRGVRRLDQALQEWDNKTHCFELHSADAPAFLTVLDKLDSWKRQCNQLNVPFFAFAVVREPISWAFSFFQFYHGGHHRKFQTYKSATEEDFLRHALPNPQCLFLTRSERLYLPERRNDTWDLSSSECNEAYEAMSKYLDYVGSTSNLSNVTIPLLSKVIGTPLNTSFAVNKSTKKNIRKDQVSNEGIGFLRQINSLDQALYDRLLSRYSSTHERWLRDDQ